MFRNALSDILPLCFLILSGESGLIGNILFINFQINSKQATPEQAAGALDKTKGSPKHLPMMLPQATRSSQEASYCLSLSDALHLPRELTYPGPNKSCLSQTFWGQDYFFPFLSTNRGIQKAIAVEIPYANP